jgi:hypothetical protein
MQWCLIHKELIWDKRAQSVGIASENENHSSRSVGFVAAISWVWLCRLSVPVPTRCVFFRRKSKCQNVQSVSLLLTYMALCKLNSYSTCCTSPRNVTFILSITGYFILMKSFSLYILLFWSKVNCVITIRVLCYFVQCVKNPTASVV